MVRLCVTFFTHDMIRAIRGRYHNRLDNNAWRVYREYHHNHMEPVNSRNAVFILREFQNVCETIATFPSPDVQLVRNYLMRKYS